MSSTMQPHLTALDIWALGITVVIGGQYFSWNAGLVAGFYSYFGALVLMSTAYITMVLCLAEASSMLPFAGGAYGLSRCSLGFYLGFMIGCCEALEYLAYVASSVLKMGHMLAIIFPSLDGYEPLVWLCIYAAAMVVHLYGGAFFWLANRVLAAVSLFVLLVYILGGLSLIDGDINAESPLLHAFSFSEVLGALPLTAWMFVGIESLNMACDEVPHPKTAIPRGQIASVVTLATTGLATYFVSAFVPPGLDTLATAVVPLNAGFQRLFGLSEATACLLSIPATYATIVGFIFAFRKLGGAIAHSKLLPPVCAYVSATRGTPVVVLVIGCSLSYAVCLAAFFVPSVNTHLFSVCILSSFCSYSAQCYGYVYLRRRFGHLDRAFTSPLGIPGAIFAFCVWQLNIISILGFQTSPGVAFGAFVFLWGLLTMYYYAYAKHHQTISDDERKILFVAHVANYNASRATQTKSGNKSQIKKSGHSSRRVLGQGAAIKYQIKVASANQTNNTGTTMGEHTTEQ
ncbi:hypothetical protein SDRG_13045 [Saprolegnia diclina VS20]|uniref:Amino acid permease/ SLC12A domain-containing protein n=1 Tax=Saprolegnia diclina (strain VS20) TaxID=1156394 RepID=T0RH80_SAPDV|nr:hypothetical protein SDRG_13045 [Saprolegnia diclina VS20]EQC29172.1 hypothetical protein SDRG_13045 [Saprolegnia diclina VS20]|eukprot:XP_008617350.1 hypothetical protein SDRG_13045 [Saprolegnia diclina VS20]